MCGHFGLLLRDPMGRPDEALLDACVRTLEHRGPDDQGIVVRGSVALCFRRLSIIDLEGGHQPLLNEDGTVAAVCNGEIYNFKELRTELEGLGHAFRTHSDAETVVHGYEEWGEAFVERCVGMFAFAIHDGRDPARPRVLIGRDRVGIKPLYWAETEEGFWWASEPKAILAAERVGRRMRATALVDYLVQGYVGGPESAWDGIHRLPPGCTLLLEGDAPPVLRRYWDLPTEGLRDPIPSEQLHEEIRESLADCVRDRLVADVPLGGFLSGGIDSTAVITEMAREVGAGVQACSVGFQERSHDELEIAKNTAKRLELRHHTQVLEPNPALAVETLPWFFDEPLADPSTVPTFLVSRMAREHVTVALSGDGGDECFAGYRRYVHDVAENRLRRGVGAPGRALAKVVGDVYPKLDWAPRFLRAKTFLRNVAAEPARAYWNSVSILSRHEVDALLDPELRHHLADHDPFHAFAEHYNRPGIEDPLYRAQYADVHTWLTDQILPKVDRASMGVSLEVRVPILDHRFLGRFIHLPSADKVQGSRGKHAFREALRRDLPTEVLDGKKRGFDTPLKAWIRGPLAEPVREALESLPGTWFDRAVLRDRLAEHASGRRDHGRLLWSLLVLEHWRRRHGVTDLAA